MNQADLLTYFELRGPLMSDRQEHLTDVDTDARDVVRGGPGAQHLPFSTTQIEDLGRSRGGADPTDQAEFVGRQGIQNPVPRLGDFMET